MNELFVSDLADALSGEPVVRPYGLERAVVVEAREQRIAGQRGHPGEEQVELLQVGPLLVRRDGEVAQRVVVVRARRAELDDVAEMVDPRLAEVEEAVDTLGGLAFVLAEAVPPVGTVLEHKSGWRIEVTAGDETHVTRLRLHPPLAGADVQ